MLAEIGEQVERVEEQMRFEEEQTKSRTPTP